MRSDLMKCRSRVRGVTQAASRRSATDAEPPRARRHARAVATMPSVGTGRSRRSRQGAGMRPSVARAAGRSAGRRIGRTSSRPAPKRSASRPATAGSATGLTRTKRPFPGHEGSNTAARSPTRESGHARSSSPDRATAMASGIPSVLTMDACEPRRPRSSQPGGSPATPRRGRGTGGSLLPAGVAVPPFLPHEGPGTQAPPGRMLNKSTRRQGTDARGSEGRRSDPRVASPLTARRAGTSRRGPRSRRACS